MQLEFISELSTMLSGLSWLPIYGMVPILATLIGISAAAVARDVFA